MKKTGQELLILLENTDNIVKISRWAENIFAHHCRELSDELEEIINVLSAMEHGPEFEYSYEELKLLAELLINEQKNPLKIITDRRIKK